MEFAATVAAAVAALAALVAVVFAKRSLDEAESSGQHLKAAASTLENVLRQEQELAELQRQAIAE